MCFKLSTHKSSLQLQPRITIQDVHELCALKDNGLKPCQHHETKEQTDVSEEEKRIVPLQLLFLLGGGSI